MDEVNAIQRNPLPHAPHQTMQPRPVTNTAAFVSAMMIHLYSSRTEVEMEGVEPSSKQGNHTLSTRLFRTFIFVL